MRKLIIAVTVVAALVTAAVALAATQRTYTQTFAAKDGGKPTTKKHSPSATFFKEHSEDPDNSANHQPKQDASVDDIFPPGSAINGAIPGTCNASNDDFRTKAQKACPKKSKVGHGSAVVRTPFNGSSDIPATVDGFNNKKKKQLILYINPQGANPIVLRGQLKGKPGKNQYLHVPIPVNCVLGSPPGCGGGGDVRIVDLKLSIFKITKKVKVRKHHKTRKVKKGYLTTPKKCPSSKLWTFTIKFHGRDGVTQTYTSKSPCK